VVGGTSQISQTPGRAECCRGNGSPGLIAQRAEPVVRGALRGKGGEPARSRACALRVVSRRASALAMPGGVASNMPTSPSSRPVWAEPFGRAGIEAAEVEAERAIAGGHGAQPLGPSRSPRRQGRHRFAPGRDRGKLCDARGLLVITLRSQGIRRSLPGYAPASDSNVRSITS
jgi:hypothetical protein